MVQQTVLAFLFAMLVSLLITPVVISYAERFKILDVPNKIKLHLKPVPAVGGVAIYLSIVITSFVAIFFNERIGISFARHSRFWLAIAVSVTLVFLIGLYDDVKKSSVWARFIVQGVAALITIFAGGIVIGNVGIPSDGLQNIGWVSAPLTVLWIVGVTNALNLIDGLDGLAGGIGFISTAAVLAISVLTTGNYMVVLVSAALCGAIAGFLRYNYAPAKIFLGDCGSMLIGYSLSVLAIIGRTKKQTVLAVLIPVLLVGVPVFDTLTSMARRLGSKVIAERKFKISYFMAMFSGDRAHIHHLLLGMGNDQRLSVVILYALSLVLASLALVATIVNQERVAVIFAAIGIVAFFAVRQGWHRVILKIWHKRHHEAA